MEINCDGRVHHPLGGGSYVFEKEIFPYLLDKVNKDKLKVTIGAQPNSSPHFGTLSVFTLAFIFAKNLKEKNASVLFEVVDTAPSETVNINGVRYQRSLKDTGVINDYMHQYVEVLDTLKKLTNVNYEVRFQSEFNSQKEVLPNIKKILAHGEEIAPILDPKHKKLRVRVPCAQCGLADKNSINNKYSKFVISSFCPEHGRFETDVDKDVNKLEYNTPLRNLVRGMAYGDVNSNPDIEHEMMRITGSDYAGFYQEELLYKTASMLDYPAHKMPTIFYSPLILDWSGAKLSKSLYVNQGAYGDIPKEFICYDFLREKYKENSIPILYDIINKWVENPYMLFRHYSIYYFMEEFKNAGKKASDLYQHQTRAY